MQKQEMEQMQKNKSFLKQSAGQADRQTDKQTDRQTYRQKSIHTKLIK